ncbi:MAG: hypothetical protein PHT94_01535 [Candidatus Nanoarchaeia archaeon]|nr:hypothetical protein [Candidatus Nanoarchaeia archaeon]
MKKGISSVVSIFFITISILLLVGFTGYYANYNIQMYLKTVESSKIVNEDIVYDSVISSVNYSIDESPILYNFIKNYDPLLLFLDFDNLGNNVTSIDKKYYFVGQPKWEDGLIKTALNLNDSEYFLSNFSLNGVYSLGFHYKLNSMDDGEIFTSDFLNIFIEDNLLKIDENCLISLSDIDVNKWSSFFLIRNQNSFQVYIDGILEGDLICEYSSSILSDILIGKSNTIIDNFFIYNGTIDISYVDYFNNILLYSNLLYFSNLQTNGRIYLNSNNDYSFYKKNDIELKELDFIKGKSFPNFQEYLVNSPLEYYNFDDKRILVVNKTGIEDDEFLQSEYNGLKIAYDFEGPNGYYNYDKSSNNNIDSNYFYINSKDSNNYLDLNNRYSITRNLNIDYSNFLIGFRLNLKNGNGIQSLIEKENSFVINVDVSDYKYSLDFGRYFQSEANFISGAYKESSIPGQSGEEEILYENYFDSQDVSNWTKSGTGTWAVENNQIKANESGYLTSFVDVSTDNFNNFTYQALVKRENNKNMGIVFSYNNSNNYWSFGTWENQNIVVDGKVNGVNSIAGGLNRTDFPVDDTQLNKWYWFKVLRNETHILFKHWDADFNEPDSWEFEILENRLLSGKVGLFSWANTIYFDNLTVKTISQESQEPQEGEYIEGSNILPKTLNYNNWYNIVVSYDSLSGAEIFVNNVLYANSTELDGAIDNLISDLYFNKNSNLNYQIDDFFLIENLDNNIISDYDNYQTFFDGDNIYFSNKINKLEAYLSNQNDKEILYPSFYNFLINSKLNSKINSNFYTSIFNLSQENKISIDVSKKDRYQKNRLYLDFSTCENRIYDFLNKDIFLDVNFGYNSPSNFGCSMIGSNSILSDLFVLNLSEYSSYFYLKSQNGNYKILSYEYLDKDIVLSREENNLKISYNDINYSFETGEDWGIVSFLKETNMLKVYYNGIFQYEFVDNFDDFSTINLNFFNGDYYINSVLFYQEYIDKSNEFISFKNILPISNFDYDINHYCSDDFVVFSLCDDFSESKYHKFIITSNDLSFSSIEIIDNTEYILLKNNLNIEYKKEDIELYINNEYKSRNDFWFLDKEKKYSDKLTNGGFIVVPNLNNIVISTKNGNKFYFN